MLTAIKKVGLTHRHAKALLRLSDDKVREAALCEMAYRNIDGDSADKYIDALLNHGEEAAVAPPRQIYVMKDVRLFLNSVEHGIEIMKNGGIDAQCFHVSDGEGVTLTIKIPCGTEKLTTV
jgi:ParB family chromosome partitioning protein